MSDFLMPKAKELLLTEKISWVHGQLWALIIDNYNQAHLNSQGLWEPTSDPLEIVSLPPRDWEAEGNLLHAVVSGPIEFSFAQLTNGQSLNLLIGQGGRTDGRSFYLLTRHEFVVSTSLSFQPLMVTFPNNRVFTL